TLASPPETVALQRLKKFSAGSLTRARPPRRPHLPSAWRRELTRGRRALRSPTLHRTRRFSIPWTVRNRARPLAVRPSFTLRPFLSRRPRRSMLWPPLLDSP